MPLQMLHTADWKSYLTPDNLLVGAKVLLVLLLASLASGLLKRLVTRMIASKVMPQNAMLIRRVVTSATWAVAAILSLEVMNFDLKLLLGALGIIGVSASLASQKGLSQAFSGLILVGERPFNVGDTITLAGVTGEVLSVDLLSTKLRTPDNLFVRVPNETMLNSVVTTVSHFPIRRLDIQVGVGYGSNIEQVSRVLFEVAEKNPLGLEDPKPIFMFNGYGDSSLDLQFCVWGRRERFLDLKNSMHAGIVQAFAKHRIEIPFPHRALLLGGGEEVLRIGAQVGGEPTREPPKAA